MVSEPIRGRGAADNPGSRFDPIRYDPDPDTPPEEAPAPQTQFFRDTSRSLITYNDSPDVGFNASINPYRGCEHGCPYCYARPTHEYFGLSAGLDFETKIFVKEDAPQLLRKELASPKWTPQTLGISGVTDCYQPIERKLQVTRRCLEVLAEFRNPAGIVTKSALVTRDIDVLTELARHAAAAVFLSITSLDADLIGKMEPRTARPHARLAAVRELAGAGIPVGVLVAPVIPGLTDHEMPAIIDAAAQAGARCAGFVVLRLPFGLPELFTGWLERHYPERKDKVLSRIRELRSGKLNDANFGSRMRGQGPIAEAIKGMFQLACRKSGIANRGIKLSAAAFRRAGAQRGLFD
ncbi:radical SAM protein [Planctomycetaceae bacterium SCGC AG-212-F19]|nr:radical SAM protein [Planctomycetaceae bacterium SCGC AG-212-F19]